MKFFTTITLALLSFSMFAAPQQPADPEEQEKKFYESIEKEVERYTDLLGLDDVQIFYVDSILTHDYRAMREELEALNKAKVSNPDPFYRCQDKWMEGIYNAFGKVLDEEQWAKYLKTGAQRDKKARDKRAAKRK